MDSKLTDKNAKSSSRRKIPNYLHKMTLAEKAANDKIVDRMKNQINYLKNPRTNIGRPPLTYQQGPTTDVKDFKNAFRVNPEVLTFTDYEINCIYEIPLTITNSSGISRRLKYLPPSSAYFTVSKVKYPNENTLVAPGMSVVLYVNFLAPSHSNFDDEIMIIGEESSFNVKLKARRENPVLTLAPVLDCQSCWLGDQTDMIFQFTNKGGESSYKFFCENEEDDKYQEGEVLKLKNFTLFPSEFNIAKGQPMELFVKFNPQQGGLIQEKVILACDNDTSQVYTLQAKANMAELRVAKINGKEITTSEDISRIFLPDIYPDIPKVTTISLKNEASVKVNYEWDIAEDNSNKEVELQEIESLASYKLEPERGVIEPNAIMDFKIVFQAKVSMPFYKRIALNIKDIPIQAIRSPPELIKKQSSLHGNSGSDLSAYRPKLTYFQFDLVSLAKFVNISVDLPTYTFPNTLVINKQYERKFKLNNISAANINYQVSFYQKSSKHLYFDIVNGSGTIKADESTEFNIKLLCRAPLANQKLIFLIKVENGDPLAVEVNASFQGPKISITQPEANFGLLQSYTSKSIDLEVNNINDVQAEVLIRRKGEIVDFAEYRNIEEPYYQWWDNLITFEPQHFFLEPNEKKIIKVKLNALEASTLHDLLEILVWDGDTYNIFYKAEVQDAHIGLSRYQLNFPALYASKSYTIDSHHEQSLKFINYGNIPATFKWKNIFDPNFTYNFEPSEGVVPPKSEVPIVFKFKPDLGADVNRLFECTINELTYPLGFEMQGSIYGLSVEYEQFPEHPELNVTASVMSLNNISEKKSDKKNATGTRSEFHRTNSSISKSKIEEPAPLKTPFEKLEIIDLKINEPKVMKFMLRNTSGLDTKFFFYSEIYEPLEHKPIETKTKTPGNTSLDKSVASHSQTHHTYSTSTKKKLDASMRHYQGALITADIEHQQNFTSFHGQMLNNKRKLEKDQKYYLTNNKGVAIVCEPHMGDLKAHQQVTITLTIYNDVCGKFEDFLCCDVKGLPIRKFPVKLKISGSPLEVTDNQVGVKYGTDYPTLVLESSMHSLGKLTKQLRLSNTGPTDVAIEWKIYNLSQMSSSDSDIFKVKFTDPDLGTNNLVKLAWEPIPPEESKEGPFEIEPKIGKVKARQTATFTVTFNSSVVEKYESVMVCKPTLEENQEDEHKTKIEELPVYVHAKTINPELTLDKRKRLEGTHLIRFEKWAKANARKETKTVVFKNKTDADLIFSVDLSGRFKLIASRTNSPKKYNFGTLRKTLKNEAETQFHLIPDSLIELDVHFEGYEENDHENWPLAPVARLPGLINITFANGIYQSFELEGALLRPILQLNTIGFEGRPVDETIEFGLCHNKNFVQKVIFLGNISKVPANWKLNYMKYPNKNTIALGTLTKLELEDEKKTDDPSVFEFSITEGCIIPNTVPINKVPNGPGFDRTRKFDSLASTLTHDTGVPTKVMINFRPKKNILYKSKFRITVEEGPSIDFILKGTGTYEENFQK